MFPPKIPPAVDDPPIIFLICTEAYILANFRRPSGYEQSLDLCVRERKQTYRTQYVTPVIANENRGLEERTKEVAEDRSETKLAHTLGTLQKKKRPAPPLGNFSSTSLLQQTHVPVDIFEENARFLHIGRSQYYKLPTRRRLQVAPPSFKFRTSRRMSYGLAESGFNKIQRTKDFVKQPSTTAGSGQPHRACVDAQHIRQYPTRVAVPFDCLLSYAERSQRLL
jgi:hypothetical protein